MSTSHGIFIAVEGTDGSGKGTQSHKLAQRLAREGYDVVIFDFPQYEQESSFFVREYLGGTYGPVNEVGPYTASLFYALDRYQAAPQIRQALEQGKIVLSNRFVGSSMAHQGTKFQHAEERRGYFIWLDNLEFEMLRTPRATLNFVLRVPAEIAQKHSSQKKKHNHTDKQQDTPKSDPSQLQKTVEVYDDMCQLFPKDFLRIDCVRDDKMMDIDTVHDILWQKVVPLLPIGKKSSRGSVTPATRVRKSSITPAIPAKVDTPVEARYQPVEGATTNASGNVYAFTDKLHPTVIAAALERLHTSDYDLRTTILDEFTASKGRDEQLAGLGTAAKRLTGVHVVVEHASNVLAGRWGQSRTVSFLEQAIGTVDYSQKDASGSYRYYTPEHMPADVTDQYRAAMDRLFELYAHMLQALEEYIASTSDIPVANRDAAFHANVRLQACTIARPALPVAATTTVGVFAPLAVLERMITRMLSDPLPEAHQTGKALLAESRKILPGLLPDIDAGATYTPASETSLHKLAAKHLPGTYAEPAAAAVQLTDVWPRNELDLVPDILYASTNVPFMELRRLAADWDYSQKIDVFETYLDTQTTLSKHFGRTLEKTHYSWDLVCDYDSFRMLQSRRIADGTEGQQLTPRYGYAVPKLVEDAGLTDQFEACFDESLKLHSILESAGYRLEAQYATLLGHRMRWKVTYNAREMSRICTDDELLSYPDCRKLVREMHEKLSEVHPLIGEAMKPTSEQLATKPAHDTATPEVSLDNNTTQTVQ